jgi:acyl-CoA synthetase (AMP-forming)/AMP-acid ligase II
MDVRSFMERAVRTWSDREAVVEGERRLTYGQAWDRGLRLANLMRASGLRAQDRVAVIEDNTLEAVDFYLACAIGNFIRVPLYARNATESHRHMMSHTGCAGLVAAEKYVPEVEGCTGSPRFLLVRDGSYEERLAAAPSDPFDDPVAESDIFIIRHTAGTSGTPKGVAYSHRKWITIMRDWLFPWPPMEVGDAFLHQSPISHGSGYFFTPAWVSGARNVMLPKADPSVILSTIERERITHMLGIPTIIASIVRHPDIATCDLSSIKALTISGAPIDEGTARQAHKVFGDVLYTGFGQTEINPVTFMNVKEWLGYDGHPGRPLSCGRVQPHGDVRILDVETHEPLPVGETGEIAARTDGQFEGFWGQPEATAERIKDGWVLTGDMGRLDKEGYLYVQDRASDMIISGGFNIYPAELENVIASHSAVLEVAVFAVPHERWGESPAAVCVVADLGDISEDEVRQICRDRLGSYKQPSTVVITTDPLPKSVAGKVLRKNLREPYWAGRSSRVAGS